MKSICILKESERTLPSHLSTYQGERIVVLWEEGKTVSEILKTLESEGRQTSCASCRLVFHWRNKHSLRDQHLLGRQSMITAEIAAFVEAKLQEDDELTSVESQRLFSRKFSISISATTIRRYIRMHLKWVVVRTRCGSIISGENKANEVHLPRCDLTQMIHLTILSGWVRVQLTGNSQTMRVKIGKERVLKPDAKDTVMKVHVWTGFSKRGATNICVVRAFLTTLLESGNWRKKTTTWRLKLQPTL